MLTEEKYSSQPLTFGELHPGEKFIDFPQDGDDNGHGGFRARHFVFQKLHDFQKEKPENNAKRLVDSIESSFPNDMRIIRVV